MNFVLVSVQTVMTHHNTTTKMISVFLPTSFNEAPNENVEIER